MNVNYLKIQYRVNPKNNKNCLNIWPFGKFYLLLCINSPPFSMKRCHFITIFSYILFFPTALSASSIDSLYHEIERQERVKLSSANQLMLLLDAEGTTDSLFHFDQHTEKEAMLSTIHLYMAAHFYEQATNMVHTLQAARRAEAAARAIGDTATIEEALAYQAVAASRMGRLDVALDATREELRLDSLSQNLPNLSRAYNTLAGLSLQAGRMEDAKLYIHKAINLERALEDSTHLSVRYGVAAEIYAKDKNYEQALDFAQRAYELDRTAGNEVRTARRLAQMADIYDAKGDLTNAEKFYLRSIEVLRAENEQKSLAINLKQLGQNYLRQHRKNANKYVVPRTTATRCNRPAGYWLKLTMVRHHRKLLPTCTKPSCSTTPFTASEQNNWQKKCEKAKTIPLRNYLTHLQARPDPSGIQSCCCRWRQPVASASEGSGAGCGPKVRARKTKGQ